MRVMRISYNSCTGLKPQKHENKSSSWHTCILKAWQNKDFKCVYRERQNSIKMTQWQIKIYATEVTIYPLGCILTKVCHKAMLCSWFKTITMRISSSRKGWKSNVKNINRPSDRVQKKKWKIMRTFSAILHGRKWWLWGKKPYYEGLSKLIKLFPFLGFFQCIKYTLTSYQEI